VVKQLINLIAVVTIEDNDVDDFNRFDAGLAGGVGLDLESVSFGVRYNYGLTKIGKDDDNSNFTSPDVSLECICFLCTLSVSLQTSLPLN
jgi:hypothetical protein